MHILMLSWEYPPYLVGGLGKHVADLSPALAALGVEITVLTPQLRGGEPMITEAGVHVIRVPIAGSPDGDLANFAVRANRSLERTAWALWRQGKRFDLIHNHDWLTSQVGIALKHAWRIPLIATIHATERGRGRGTLNGRQSLQINHMEWSLTYEAWRVIVCSQFMSDEVATFFSTPRDKIDIVPNGVEFQPNPFTSSEERRALRRRFAEDDQPLAFYIGRLVYEKGLHILIDAWQQVHAQTGGHLVIAGTGPMMETLRTQAHTNGIGEAVHIAGFIDDTLRNQLYHLADMAIFPSLYEPFGIVALEAFAAHCPLIVSQTGGLAEVVRPHETGILVEPGNVDSLVWGIMHVLQHPAWTQERVTNAFNDLEQHYTWDHIATTIQGIYRRVQEDWRSSDWGRVPSLSYAYVE